MKDTLDVAASSRFSMPISETIWDAKYRLKDPEALGPDAAAGRAVHDLTVEDTWRRVARALSVNEASQPYWEERFLQALEDFRFLPAGRITAGAGTGRNVTLFNCYVMGTVADSMPGIFDAVKEAALTMQQGGGIGYDFSTIRPRGAPVVGVGSDASGPLSFMDVWDSMCRTIMSAGSRRGAMMATMRCDHPDIEDFISAKKDPLRLRNFNVSVLVTDPFMEAVKADADWDLVFGGKVWRTVRARDLWEKITRSTYEFAEPGVIFIDRINKLNPLSYCETIAATNPCGEQPLPPYGACLLGSINLARLVKNAFDNDAHLDLEELEDLVMVAVRMMDNVIDVSNFPLPQQQREATQKRRIGLGVTGLADALMMIGQTYGSEEAAATTREWMRRIANSAARASVSIAREKGAFPLFDRDAYLASPTIAKLDQDVRDGIREHGIRNALMTSIAPTGTISLYAGNVSSGIEPVFAHAYTRKVTQKDGSKTEEEVVDYAVQLWREKFGSAPYPAHFVTAQSLTPADHVRMQAAAQEWVDSSISKTINCPEGISFEDFQDVYMQAWDQGCKGCTTYRPNAVTGSILTVKPEAPETPKSEPEAVAAAPIPHPQPMERPEAVEGNTYKLKWPGSDHAIYITINDVIQDGRRIPFEMFINSKNMEHYAWTVALTRMISAVFRRAGDVSFVVEELKAVFDPRGGSFLGGRYVPSMLAAIGGVIERHLQEIGYAEAAIVPQPARREVDGGAAEAPPVLGPQREGCPDYGNCNFQEQSGCRTCSTCGWSSCG